MSDTTENLMEKEYMQQKIADVGAQVSKTYCDKRKLSNMFPKAPLPKFPDKFPEGELSNKEAKERNETTNIRRNHEDGGWQSEFQLWEGFLGF